MSELSYRTKSENKNTVQKDWWVIDATDQIVGRLSSKIAKLLRGKHKPGYTPHVDCGDHVIVINAEKVRFTGKKWTEKEYVRYSNYPGGQKRETPQEVMERFPTRIIEKAVKGMLPRNRLSRKIMKNLYIYEGPEHDHEAQQPKTVDINSIK